MGSNIRIFFDNDAYFAGSLMKGKIVVEVSQPQYYSDITVALVGRAQTFWDETTYYGRSRLIMHYRNKVKYVNAQKVMWTSARSPTGDLRVGSHSFNFEYQFPRNIPASFEGPHGQVRYDVIVTSSKNGYRNIPSATARLHIKDSSNLLVMHREPAVFEMDDTVTFFCHNLGSIAATCTIPRTGFSPGERIPLNVHVVNLTSRNIRVKAALIRRDLYIGPKNIKQITSEKKIASVSVPTRIRKRQITVVDISNLKIPLNAVTTIRNCQCIGVEYSVVVKFVIPLNFNRTMSIPIVVAYEPPPLPPEEPQINVQIRMTPQQVGRLLCAALLPQQQGLNQQQRRQQAPKEPQQRQQPLSKQQQEAVITTLRKESAAATSTTAAASFNSTTETAAETQQHSTSNDQSTIELVTVRQD